MAVCLKKSNNPIEYCDFCTRETAVEYPRRINRFLQTGKKDAVWMCRQCGLLFRTELPEYSTSAAKAKAMAAKGLAYGDRAAGTQMINRRMQKRLDYLKSLVNMPKEKTYPSLLDIGTGAGSFLSGAMQDNWDAVGTEIDKIDKVDAQLEIQKIDLTASELEGRRKASFDVVHCNHVLEHVAEPASLLKVIHMYLKPGGYLAIEVPNEIYSLASRIKRVSGVKYNGATAYFSHRYFFNRTILARYLDAAGFEIISIRTPFMDIALPWWHRCFDLFQAALRMGGAIEILAQKPKAQ